MPTEAISEAILLIASVVLIATLASGLYISIGYISGATISSSLHNSQKLLTQVQIVFATNISSTTLYVYIQNIGEYPVYNFALGTLYFGLENQEQPIGYGGPAPSWSTNTQVLNPGSTAQITITLSSSLVKGSFYTVMYVTPNGVSSSYTFEVT